MRNCALKHLITMGRGVSEAEAYESYILNNPQLLAATARELMAAIPPTFGACAMMSATWAGFLKDRYSIPAIVVAGDLAISGTRIFKCTKNLPDVEKSGRLVTGNWDGHCWIEIDGFIGDLSIFRTAYAVNGPSILKDFVILNFGYGRGAMLSPHEQVPEGMQYIPRFVLNDNQMNGLIAGMRYQLENCF